MKKSNKLTDKFLEETYNDEVLNTILPQGVYIIKYTSETGSVESKQVFIK